MTVYVDDAMIPAGVPNGDHVVFSQWSHLMADTREELIAFATGPLRMSRSWLQDKPSGVHFDLTVGKRAAAIAHGAVPIESGSPEWMRVHQLAKAQYATHEPDWFIPGERTNS